MRDKNVDKQNQPKKVKQKQSITGKKRYDNKLVNASNGKEAAYNKAGIVKRDGKVVEEVLTRRDYLSRKRNVRFTTPNVLLDQEHYQNGNYTCLTDANLKPVIQVMDAIIIECEVPFVPKVIQLPPEWTPVYSDREKLTQGVIEPRDIPCYNQYINKNDFNIHSARAMTIPLNQLYGHSRPGTLLPSSDFGLTTNTSFMNRGAMISPIEKQQLPKSYMAHEKPSLHHELLPKTSTIPLLQRSKNTEGYRSDTSALVPIEPHNLSYKRPFSSFHEIQILSEPNTPEELIEQSPMKKQKIIKDSIATPKHQDIEIQPELYEHTKCLVSNSVQFTPLNPEPQTIYPIVEDIDNSDRNVLSPVIETIENPLIECPEIDMVIEREPLITNNEDNPQHSLHETVIQSETVEENSMPCTFNPLPDELNITTVSEKNTNTPVSDLPFFFDRFMPLDRREQRCSEIQQSDVQMPFREAKSSTNPKKFEQNPLNKQSRQNYLPELKNSANTLREAQNYGNDFNYLDNFLSLLLVPFKKTFKSGEYLFQLFNRFPIESNEFTRDKQVVDYILQLQNYIKSRKLDYFNRIIESKITKFPKYWVLSFLISSKSAIKELVYNCLNNPNKPLNLSSGCDDGMIDLIENNLHVIVKNLKSKQGELFEKRVRHNLETRGDDPIPEDSMHNLNIELSDVDFAKRENRLISQTTLSGNQQAFAEQYQSNSVNNNPRLKPLKITDTNYQHATNYHYPHSHQRNINPASFFAQHSFFRNHANEGGLSQNNDALPRRISEFQTVTNEMAQFGDSSVQSDYGQYANQSIPEVSSNDPLLPDAFNL